MSNPTFSSIHWRKKGSSCPPMAYLRTYDITHMPRVTLYTRKPDNNSSSPVSQELSIALFVDGKARVLVPPPIPLDYLLSAYIKHSIMHNSYTIGFNVMHHFLDIYPQGQFNAHTNILRKVTDLYHINKFLFFARFFGVQCRMQCSIYLSLGNAFCTSFLLLDTGALDCIELQTAGDTPLYSKCPFSTDKRLADEESMLCCR